MNEFQINQLLVKKGLKKADIARAFHNDYPSLSEKYARKIIYGHISGRDWIPKYAQWLKTNYGINLQKPEWAMSVRQRLQRQAA